ncbi:hypothetical protein K445DRAFT_18854 [Daldinia sp. EC12]|nr:hypothetical protein K445DRAFT_18854 [Daldinia sp. EC12]
MRLLNTHSFELRSDDQAAFLQDGYAVLSHRWVGKEVTFDQLYKYLPAIKAAEKPLSSPQVDKIRAACITARNQGIKWMWIDSCCIDKSSTVEETESINSMFKWYRDATVCITYLCDVDKNFSPEPTTPQPFRSINRDGPSEWFFRGWTLQELLAPRRQLFYDTHWNYIGTKDDLAYSLEQITGIEMAYLTSKRHFGEASIAAKMSWMAKRTTTRVEDIAYSMLGIFNVNMNPQYGEGIKAFRRLQQILLSTSTDESILAWRMPTLNAGAKYNFNLTDWKPDEWGLLAPFPEWFKDSGRVTVAGHPSTSTESRFSMVPSGIRAPVVLTSEMSSGEIITIVTIAITTCFVGLPGALIWAKKRRQKRMRSNWIFPLNCWERDEFGKMVQVQIYIRPLLPSKTQFKRVLCTEFGEGTEFLKNKERTMGTISQPEFGYIS